MRIHLVSGALVVFAIMAAPSPSEAKNLRAGAAAVDITPVKLPVIINGGMLERTADKITDRIHARAIVLADDSTRIAMVIVDSCMLPRELLDEAKEMAQKQTGIAADHILISATHAHSVPSSMGCLGSDADAEYQKFVTPLL